MEIIGDIERQQRHVYTGAIGRVAPDGEASFNVAIRTLTLKAGQDKAAMGLGSGIVADSLPQEEWRDCIATGTFVYDSATRFDLIQSMSYDTGYGFVELDRHQPREKSCTDPSGFPLAHKGTASSKQFRAGNN